MSDKEVLRVMDAARQFSEQCIDLAQSLPRRAPAGLRTQLAEAAQAVSDVLAEGFGRGTPAEKIHYGQPLTRERQKHKGKKPERALS